MGKPQKEMFAVDNPELKEAEKKIDVLVDSSVAECGMDPGDANAVQNEPAEEPEEELTRAHYDIAGYGDPETEENEYPPGPQNPDDLGEIPEEPMTRQFEQIFTEKGEYQAFFKRMMDKEGVTGIAKLSPEKKSEFFKKVSAGWKKEKGKSVAETFLV